MWEVLIVDQVELPEKCKVAHIYLVPGGMSENIKSRNIDDWE